MGKPRPAVRHYLAIRLVNERACGALWNLVEHLLSIRTAGAAEEKCERWKLGVRLTDIFNKYHAGPLIHKLYTKIHNILTNARMHFTHSYLASESFLISIR